MFSGARCTESVQTNFIKLQVIEMGSRKEAKMKVIVKALSGKTKCDEKQKRSVDLKTMSSSKSTGIAQGKGN